MNKPWPYPHPEYTVSRHYNYFRIIRWKQVAARWQGETVGEFDDFETARRAVYDLNGWQYKPKTASRNGDTDV